MSRERHLLWVIATVTCLIVAVMAVVSPRDGDAEEPAQRGGDAEEPAPADPQAPPPSGPSEKPSQGTDARQPVSVDALASWQLNVPADTIRERLNRGENGSGCTSLVALASLPDLNGLPDQSAAEVSEYFTRWLALADDTLLSTEGNLKEAMTQARSSMAELQRLVNEAGGALNEDVANQFFQEKTALPNLVNFFTLVAAQCDQPPDSPTGQPPGPQTAPSNPAAAGSVGP